MIACALWGFFVLKHHTERLVNDVDMVIEASESGDFKAAAELSKELDADWGRFSSIKILIIDNEHCLEVTSSIAKIMSLTSREDESAIEECHSVKKLIYCYYQEQIPSFLNIL